MVSLWLGAYSKLNIHTQVLPAFKRDFGIFMDFLQKRIQSESQHTIVWFRHNVGLKTCLLDGSYLESAGKVC